MTALLISNFQWKAQMDCFHAQAEMIRLRFFL
jgi:hypothetical protein